MQFSFLFLFSFGLASSSISMIDVETEQDGRKKYPLYVLSRRFRGKNGRIPESANFS
jgi:hypothetical protein